MFQIESEEIRDIEKNSAIYSIVLTMKQIGITVSEIEQEFLRDSDRSTKDYFEMKSEIDNYI